MLPPPITVICSPGGASPQRIADWMMILASSKVFKELGEPKCQQTLLNTVSYITCSAGGVLFQKDDPPGNCYVLLSGKIGILVLDAKRKAEERAEKEAKAAQQAENDLANGRSERVVEYKPKILVKTVDGFSYVDTSEYLGDQVNAVMPGAILGELALLNNQPRSAAAKCIVESELLVIRKVDFDSILKEEMVRKETAKFEFLTKHVPGLRSIPFSQNVGKNAHPCYWFHKVTYLRGHHIFSQGIDNEPMLCVIKFGCVDFHSSYRDGEEKAAPKGLKRNNSCPSAHFRQQPKVVITKLGTMVEGGVFGTLSAVPGKTFFSAVVASPVCEVYQLLGNDVSHLPTKLQDTVQVYLSATTAWRAQRLSRTLDCIAKGPAPGGSAVSLPRVSPGASRCGTPVHAGGHKRAPVF